MKTALALSFLAFTGAALAAPATYEIEPNHTAPSFEVDHFGGLSIIRGKFTKTSGKIVLDKEAGTGTVDITVDTSSILFGNEKLEKHVQSAEMLNVAQYPTASYRGKLVNFKNGAPTEVQGELTLHGVTKPVNLKITQFLCKPHPMLKKEDCGADAEGHFKRDEFGVDYGKAMGFRQDVKLRIEVEAIKAS